MRCCLLYYSRVVGFGAGLMGSMSQESQHALAQSHNIQVFRGGENKEMGSGCQCKQEGNEGQIIGRKSGNQATYTVLGL